MTCALTPAMECVEHSNPRHAGTCVRCNRPIVPVPAPEPIRRDLTREQEIVREAARGAVDPTRLIEHAQRRAERLSSEYVSDAQFIAAGKDRLREAREEATDGVNHLLFWLQEGDFEDERRDDVMIALRFFALAYDRLLDN